MQTCQNVISIKDGFNPLKTIYYYYYVLHFNKIRLICWKISGFRLIEKC